MVQLLSGSLLSGTATELPTGWHRNQFLHIFLKKGNDQDSNSRLLEYNM